VKSDQQVILRKRCASLLKILGICLNKLFNMLSRWKNIIEKGGKEGNDPADAAIVFVRKRIDFRKIAKIFPSMNSDIGLVHIEAKTRESEARNLIVEVIARKKSLASSKTRRESSKIHGFNYKWSSRETKLTQQRPQETVESISLLWHSKAFNLLKSLHRIKRIPIETC
jgi:hypothetical protein